MKLKPFLVVSLIANFFIALFKIMAAAFTGSAAMASAGIHSVIDVINQVLLIWGIKTSKKSPDFSRPFGYWKELYFWSSILSLVNFIIGACASFYQGLVRASHPYTEVNQTWSYMILAIAFIFSTLSIIFTLKRLNKKNDEISIWEAAELSTDPSTFVVALGALGDMAGVVVALVGLLFSKLFHSAYYDAAASVIIGLILLTLSFLLAYQCKKLLMSEIISPTTLRKIVNLTTTDHAVVDVKKHFTMYLAPKEALLILETVFKDDLNSHEVKDSIDRISKLITSRYPRIKKVYIDQAAA